MSRRFESVSALLRRLLLGAFYASGALYFWLPCHEVFEGPKVQASLIYALALAVLALPLAWHRLPPLWRSKPALLVAGAAVLGTTLASLLGAYGALPSNLLLSLEHMAPVLAAASAALVFWLEDADQRQRVLFLWLCAHTLLSFYGLIQVLDQNWGSSHGVVIDLIRWTQFGQSRVYSTMGNPDYMAAHLTLVLPLMAALGWRRIDPRGPAQVAALALLGIPLLLLPAIYGGGPLLNSFLKVLGPWAFISAALFFLARRLSPKACWLFLMGLLVLLVLLAQGRGAYLALAVSLAVMAAAAWRLGGAAWYKDRWSTLKPVAAVVAASLALLFALLVGRAASPQAAFFKGGAVGSSLKAIDSLWDRVAHQTSGSDDAQIVRKFYWKAAWSLGLQHPIFGIGFGNHALFTARAQSGVWKAMEAAGDQRVLLVEPHVELYTHNDLLQNWAETGLLGLAAFLFFWWVFAKEAWARAKAGRDELQDLGIGLLGVGVAFMVNAQVNFPWRVLATQQLCWLAVAIVALGPTLWDEVPVVAEPELKAPVKVEAIVAALIVAFLLALYPVRWFFASTLFKQGNLRKDAQQVQAVPYYEKAVKAGLSGTQEVELYLYLGSMYNVAQRSDLAEQAFKKGLAAYPDFLEALYNLGYTYQARFTQGHALADLQTAQSYYEQLLSIDPRYLNALNNLGNLYYAQKQYDKAVVVYQRLARFGPGMVEGHYNLGATYLMTGDATKALEAFEDALKIKPDYPAALQYAQQLRKLPKGSRVKIGGQ